MLSSVALVAGSVQAEAQPGEVRFVSSSSSVNESSGSATVEVERIGGREGMVSVDYATADGSATAGLDYTTSLGTLTWEDGDASPRSFQVPILDDAIAEPPETVNLTLSTPTGGAMLVAPSSATLTIVDNDGANPSGGTLSFTAMTYQVGESAGQAQITVSRSEGASGPATVDYATSDGSALAGLDYQATSGTLAWASGDGSSKGFTVTVIDDSEVEGDETFGVALSGPSGATLGPSSASTVVIRDDDQSVESCAPDSQTLCLGAGGRFRVQVGFDPPIGEPSQGQVVEIGRRDSGLVYFFDPNNIEMLVKVLDACGINNHYWVFFAATTNVEFTLRVDDTQGSSGRVYTNPQGQSADAVTDTSAFATCP